MTDRRSFFQILAGAGVAAAQLPAYELIASIKRNLSYLETKDPEEIARSEEFWEEVRGRFFPPQEFIQLENGYFSQQPADTLESFQLGTAKVNRETSFYMRNRMGSEMESIRKRLAEFALGHPEEIAILRNTTEALDILIHGIDLEPGDEVIVSRQDYGSMLEAWDQQAERFGLVIRRVSLPVPPASTTELIECFERAITEKTRVMLVTHMINLNGTILPAAELVDLGRRQGIQVIVDGAHSFAHVDFKLPDLDCDYFGTSLHKWLCCPMGTGMLQISRDRISEVWPLFGDRTKGPEDVRKFEHVGTRPPASYLAIAQAIDFHEALGGSVKEARLRFLKNLWAEPLQELSRVRLNTSTDPSLSCGIGNFSIQGYSPEELSRKLFDEYRIFTVAIDTEEVKGVRVTPHLFTTRSEVESLVRAVEVLAT